MLGSDYLSATVYSRSYKTDVEKDTLKIYINSFVDLTNETPCHEEVVFTTVTVHILSTYICRRFYHKYQSIKFLNQYSQHKPFFT